MPEQQRLQNAPESIAATLALKCSVCVVVCDAIQLELRQVKKWTESKAPLTREPAPPRARAAAASAPERISGSVVWRALRLTTRASLRLCPSCRRRRGALSRLPFGISFPADESGYSWSAQLLRFPLLANITLLR